MTLFYTQAATWLAVPHQGRDIKLSRSLFDRQLLAGILAADCH